MRTRHALVAAATLALAGSTAGAALTGASAAPAAHRAEPTVTPVAKKLTAPLSVAVAPDGTRYFSDNFAGVLYKQTPGGTPTVIFKGPKKAEVGAVSATGGQLRFSVSEGNNDKGTVWTLDATGTAVKVADTGRAEKKQNPDGRYHYGFKGLAKSCLSQIGPDVPTQTWGAEETHPYASTVVDGTTYVADAGANAVFAFAPDGTVRSFMVPAAVVRITPQAQKALHLPACTVGARYALEAVPTDIEAGPGGALYVTSLPGGPEDGSLGANGRVLRLDVAKGRFRTLVRGLVSPTGLAVDGNGDMYVAQLFAGVIAKVTAGSSKARPFAHVVMPADVEVVPGGLVATAHALPGKKPQGQVVTITP